MPARQGTGAPGWLLFYSPDFTLTNQPAAGGYQAMTEPGQACRYQWDTAPLVGTSPTVRLRLYNNGRGANAPIVARLPRSVIGLPPPAQGRALRVVVQDVQGRPSAGSPVRVGAVSCAGEGTTDVRGTAILRVPAGCP